MDDLYNSRRNRTDLTSAHRNVREVVNWFFRHYQAYARRAGKPLVSSKNIDEYKRHIRLIILDLLSAWEGDKAKFVGYNRGKRYFIKDGPYWNYKSGTSRISNIIYTNVIDFLAAEKFIDHHPRRKGFPGISSRMRASYRLIRVFSARRLNWACIDVFDGPEIIVKHGDEYVPYPTAEGFGLDRAFENVRRINSTLQTTFINLRISDQEMENLKKRMAREQVLDDDEEPREPFEFSNRTLRRIFANGTFNNGGRFYGGWWQGIPSQFRKYIEIDGAMTVEMDYSTMQPRMLYALVHETPPNDAYILEGWDSGLRPIIKKAFNQLLNSATSSRHQNQWHRFAPDLLPDPLPSNWGSMSKHERNLACRNMFEAMTGRDYSNLLRDLLEVHTPIEQFFFSGTWGKMQRKDSDIAERVMLKLLNLPRPVTALPIHDSFIVRRGAEKTLHNAMEEAFEEVVGLKPEIDRDETVFDLPSEDYVPGLVIPDEDFGMEVLKDIEAYSGYYRREAEWTSIHGPID